MTTQTFVFGKVRIEITPNAVVWSSVMPAWLRRLSPKTDLEHLKGFIEGGRLISRIDIHRMGRAVVEVHPSGAAYLELLEFDQELSTRGVGRLLHTFVCWLQVRIFPGGMGIIPLRGDDDITRAIAAAAAINSLASAYQSQFRKNLWDLVHLYNADARYTWEIRPSLARGMFRMFLYIVGLCVVLPTVVYGVLVLLELISAGFAFWTSVILTGFIACGVITLLDEGPAKTVDLITDASLNAQDPYNLVDPNSKRLTKILTQFAHAAMLTASMISSFAVVGFMVGSPLYWFAEDFSPSLMSRPTWSLFLLELLLDTLTLDVFGALNVDIAQVSANGRGAAISVVATKFLMASGVVAAIYRAVKTGQNAYSFVGTPRELLTEVLTNTNFLSIGEIVLNGKVITLPRSYVFDTRTPEQGWEAP